MSPVATTKFVRALAATFLVKHFRRRAQHPFVLLKRSPVTPTTAGLAPILACDSSHRVSDYGRLAKPRPRNQVHSILTRSRFKRVHKHRLSNHLSFGRFAVLVPA
jgi:hypothetical protein